jgi:hypothetical protein
MTSGNGDITENGSIDEQCYRNVSPLHLKPCRAKSLSFLVTMWTVHCDFARVYTVHAEAGARFSR